MKKYIYLTLHYCFFITALLFLPKDIALFTAILLINLLTFENPFFSILPLAICFYMPLPSIFILCAVVLYQFIFYHFYKKNRYYALGVYVLSTCTAFVTLWIINGFQIQYLQIMLLLFVLYSIMNLLYVYQKNNQEMIIIPYNQKLIDLTMMVGYLALIMLYGKDKPYLIFFLFMQLYLIKDQKYNLLFAGIYGLFIGLTNFSNFNTVLLPIAISFLPVSIIFGLNYEGFLWIPLLIYSIIVQFVHIKDKKITIENNYINSLFDDFNQYLNQLNKEYQKNNLIKEIKEHKLKEISTQYCSRCTKNTLCKTKPDRRYSFLSAAMLGSKQNIFNCPYYAQFDLNMDIEYANKIYESSAIKSLAVELSYLYNQSLMMKKEYQKFINILADNGYIVTDLDMNMASSSLYFSIELNHQKPIIESILVRACYKAFGEQLELKIIDDRIYFYKKPQLKITYAHTILAKEGNLMSGDNYYIKKDYNSSYIFALSDGMGNGVHAYTESADALKTIINLTSYHFRIKTILKLLEDIYELRSNYDRYATLDLLSIDTANRKLNLYKMGSSTTYILHNNQLFSYENKSLPLKLDEVNSSYELDVFSGDYIFLLSDGISDFINKNEFYNLVQAGNQSADELCYSIIEYIKKKENNNLKDDLSLIVIKAI